MTANQILVDDYFIRSGSLLKVTSVSATKVNSTINIADLTEIPVTQAALLAIGFILEGGKYVCPFAHYINVPLDLSSFNISDVSLKMPSVNNIQNIIKSITKQSLTISEEALKDAALGTDLIAPALLKGEVTSTSFEISWAAVAHAAGYKISIDGGTNYSEPQTETSFSKADATPGTTYSIKVIATAAAGSGYRDSYESSALEIVTLIPLTAPTLVVGTITSTTLSVSWAAINDAIGYQVSVDDGVTYGDTQEGLVFTKEDAVASTLYNVKVKAIAAPSSLFEDSPASTGEAITTLTPLVAPTLVEGTVTTTTFELSWAAIENAIGYQVSIDDGVTYGLTQEALTFSKLDAYPATAYPVKVRAVAAPESIYEDSPSASILITTIGVLFSSVEINSGDATTLTDSVSVAFTYAGTPTHYRLTETSVDMETTPWVAFVESPVAFTLSAGYEEKTVYAQLKDADMDSAVKSDSIVYSES